MKEGYLLPKDAFGFQPGIALDVCCSALCNLSSSSLDLERDLSFSSANQPCVGLTICWLLPMPRSTSRARLLEFDLLT